MLPGVAKSAPYGRQATILPKAKSMKLMSQAPYRTALRTLGALFLLGSCLTAVVLIPATPALADNCSSEQTIFVYDSVNTASYGTQGDVYIRNRHLDPNCSGFRAWSMVNITNSDGSEQVETGYREYSGTSFDGVTCYQFSFTNESCHLWSGIATIIDSRFYGFKVAHYPLNTSQFETWVNGLCSGCSWVKTSAADMPFSKGYSQAETGRYGHTSGMLDHHKSLKRKNYQNNWYNWGGQSCSPNGTSYGNNCTINNNSSWTFYYHKMSDTNYEVCQKGGACPWQ